MKKLITTLGVVLVLAFTPVVATATLAPQSAVSSAAAAPAYAPGWGPYNPTYNKRMTKSADRAIRCVSPACAGQPNFLEYKVFVAAGVVGQYFRTVYYVY